MMIRFSAITVSLAVLAACTTTSRETPVVEAPPVPHMTPAVSQQGALQQREPDTCHAQNQVAALGQPASIIPTLGITRPINVVEWRGIEPQEYNPQRIVFRLDQAGNIFNIDCG